MVLKCIGDKEAGYPNGRSKDCAEARTQIEVLRGDGDAK